MLSFVGLHAEIFIFVKSVPNLGMHNTQQML